MSNKENDKLVDLIKDNKDEMLSKISLRMQEINDEINEHKEALSKLREEQTRLIADWQRETK